jgi:hypothetical protein
MRPLACWDCGFESHRGMDVCCECCVLSDWGLCDELITRPEESYRLWCVVVCELETSWMRRTWSTVGCRAKNKQTKTQTSFTSYNLFGLHVTVRLSYHLHNIIQNAYEHRCTSYYQYVHSTPICSQRNKEKYVISRTEKVNLYTSYGICGEQSGTGTGFLQVILSYPVSIITPTTCTTHTHTHTHTIYI